MKYFLVLGIEYKFFKKPGNITIHVGDRFIDTFQLDRDFLTADILPYIESKWFKRFGKGYALTRAEWTEQWDKMPVLFKVYEIDDSAIKGKLEIKVENSHSDYTNGFMKNSSLIKFPIVALFKKELVRNHGEKMMKALIKVDNALSIQNYKGGPKVTVQWWPCAESFYVVRENEFYQKSEIRNQYWFIGGSFTAQFEIVKKYDTKYIAPIEDQLLRGFTTQGLLLGFTTQQLLLASCGQLLNIYNEDK